MALSDDDIIAIAGKENVRPEYLMAILGQENSKDTDISGSGAMGRGQLLPATFAQVHPKGDINDPKDNIIAAARYLKQGLDKNDGDFQAAAAYYYAGPSWAQKIKTAPNKRYGTNADGTAGISIEDYSRKAFSRLPPGDTTPSNADFDTGSPTVVTPNRDDFDTQLAELTRAADAQFGKVEAANQTLSGQIKKNMENQVAAIRKGGELEAGLQMDKFQQVSAQAGEASARLSRLGINESDLDSTVAKISTQINADYELAQQMRAGIDEKRSVGLFDDPIQFVINSLTLNDDIRKHNAVIQRINSQKQYVDQATDFSQKVQQANSAKFTSVSLEGAKAAAEIQRNKAEVEALKTEDLLAKQDFETQTRTLGLIQQRITIRSALESAEVNRGVKRTIEQDRIDKAEAQKLDDAQVQIAGNMLGMEVRTRKELDKMPKDVKETINTVIANGGTFGGTPLETLQILKKGNINYMPPAVKYQKDLLESIAKSSLEALKAKSELKTANAKDLKQMLSDEMSNEMTKAMNDPNRSIRPTGNGTVDNPYHVPDYSVMRALPDARGLPITKLLDQHRTNFPGPVSDGVIMNLAYENIGPGKPYRDMTDAARDVSRFYQAGIAYNNSKMQFEKFNMAPQKEYQVNGIDLSSYQSVMKEYLKRNRMETPTIQPDFGLGQITGGVITKLSRKIKGEDE